MVDTIISSSQLIQCVEVAVDPAGGAGCAGGADGFGDPAGQRPQVRLSPGRPICRGGILRPEA